MAKTRANKTLANMGNIRN